jgi:endoglucanase
MKSSSHRLGALAVLILPFALHADDAPVAKPFPQHARYAPGSLRPGNHPQTQLDQDVRDFYNDWKSEYLHKGGRSRDGHQLYRVTFGSDEPDRTVSEGQGYGMLIVALMAGFDPDAKKIFDGLHAFALAHPSPGDGRLMNWEVPGRPSSSAFDGDADIAYALLLGHAQWGSSGVDYLGAAKKRLAGMLSATIGPRTKLPMLGDWVKPDGKKHNQSTPRSSDFMPGHFRVFAKFTGDETWNAVAAACEKVVAEIQSGPGVQTGLLPDFILKADTSPRPARAGFLEGDSDGDFSYNAGRVPWRLGTDALLNPGTASAQQAARISAWARKVTGEDPQRLQGGYLLNGKPVEDSDYFTTFFAAPLGVAAMVDPEGQAWLNAVYDSVRDTHEDYFEDSVNLLCLLVMTGNFWQPE